LYGKGASSEAYGRYLICKEFGWDYYTYEAQPSRFIEEISIIMNQEAQKQKREIEKAKVKRPHTPATRRVRK